MKVALKAFYGDDAPGSEVDLNEAEAARLIGIGAAEAVNASVEGGDRPVAEGKPAKAKG